MNETDRIQREEGIVATHQKNMTILWVALFVTVNIVMFLSVWLLKDTITADQLLLVPAVCFMLLYFLFSCYSVYACLATEIQPETKVSGKLLWWHGASVMLAMGATVIGGLIFTFIKGL